MVQRAHAYGARGSGGTHLYYTLMPCKGNSEVTRVTQTICVEMLTGTRTDNHSQSAFAKKGSVLSVFLCRKMFIVCLLGTAMEQVDAIQQCPAGRRAKGVPQAMTVC